MGRTVPWDRELVTSAGILSCAACTLNRPLDTGQCIARETVTEAASEEPLGEDSPKSRPAGNQHSQSTYHSIQARGWGVLRVGTPSLSR